MSHVHTVLSWVWRLLYLNVLWLLFSLPLITVFPSTFALYRMTHHILTTKGEEPSLKRFTQEFVVSFWRSYSFALPVLLFFAIVWLDFNILYKEMGLLSQIWFYMIMVLTMIGFTVIHFALYLIVSLDLRMRDTWTLGFVLSVRYPFHSVSILMVYVLVSLLFLLQTGVGLLFVGSLLSFCVSMIAKHAFSQFEQQVLQQSS